MAGMQISGLASGMDTDSIIKNLMQVEQSKIDKVDKQKMLLEMRQEVWAEMNAKLYSFYTKNLFELKSQGSYKTKNVTISDETKIGVSASSSAVAGIHTLKVTQLAKGAHLYSNAIADDTVVTSEAMAFKLSDGTKTVDIELAAGATISDLMTAINEQDLNITASYDSKNKRIFMNSTSMGDTSAIQFSEVDSAAEADFFTSLGFSVNGTTIKDVDAGALGAAGQNSIYEYDGIVFEDNSNSVSVNGLSLTLKAESTNITVNITNDTEAVYNKIKDFIKAYNDLIEDMTTKLDAKSNKYEPLTNAEKESLDDKTIESWEAKVKERLLRRDDKLTSISSTMRSILTSSSGVDMSKLSEGFRFLSELGIVTGDYTEKGKLHIEGDSEDSLFALKPNKLKEALEENPEKVAALFTAIGNKLYTTMADKMKSTSLNSALTFYNDKQMKKQVTEYEDRMFDLESRMSAMETRYRAQFTAMEQAIQKANNQSTYLSNMLSGSSS